jgi:hypothetical protein
MLAKRRKAAMTTHNDLWIAARARMQILEHELNQRHRAPRPNLIAASVLHRASDLLLSLSRRLECYAERLMARSDSPRWEESLQNPC